MFFYFAAVTLGGLIGMFLTKDELKQPMFGRACHAPAVKAKPKSTPRRRSEPVPEPVYDSEDDEDMTPPTGYESEHSEVGDPETAGDETDMPRDVTPALPVSRPRTPKPSKTPPRQGSPKKNSPLGPQNKVSAVSAAVSPPATVSEPLTVSGDSINETVETKTVSDVSSATPPAAPTFSLDFLTSSAGPAL